MFVATRTGSSTYAYSNYGVVWATGTAQISSASGIDAVTFGSNNATPRFLQQLLVVLLLLRRY